MRSVNCVMLLLLSTGFLSCSTQYIKKCDSDYSYATIASGNIYYSKPFIKGAKTTFEDKHKNNTEDIDNDINGIKNDMYNNFVSLVNVKGLNWKPLDAGLNDHLNRIKLLDTVGNISIEQDILNEFNTFKIDYIIIIYDFVSNQQQSTDMNTTFISNSNSQGGVSLTGFTHQTSFFHLDFIYKCAIIDVNNKAEILFVNIHESKGKPLNFYEKVCDKLINLLIKTD
jgi:hypothetical protein